MLLQVEHCGIQLSIALLELMCPLDSVHHLESARNKKQSKFEYLAELGRQSITNYMRQ